MRSFQTRLIMVLAAALVLVAAGVCRGEGNLRVVESAKPFRGPKFSSGEFLVKFNRGVSEEQKGQIHKQQGVSVLSVSPRGKFQRLRVPQGKTVAQLVAAYARNPYVAYAEPNYLRRALFTPNDPYYPYQWHLDNPTGSGINMEEAWDVSLGGSPSVVVAVVDTGVAYEDYGAFALAPDLAGTTFVWPKNLIANDGHANDDNGHGTHVTGTIAQNTNNGWIGTGVAGVAFNTAIMPVKVLNANGEGTDQQVADGIYWAADHGAKVINLSLGAEGYSETLAQACQYAYEAGITIVCAAGNNYPNNDIPVYPAAYDDYCIAVGATRFDKTRAPYSNTGSFIDLVAPGGDLSVDQNGDSYPDGVLQETMYYFYDWFAATLMSGTSMATAHVSGVAALIIAHKGDIGPDQVREHLEQTAQDLGQVGRDDWYGHGLVNAYAALTYAPPVRVHDIAVTTLSAPTSCYEGNSVNITVRVANQGNSTETGVPVTVTDATTGELINTQYVALGPGESSADLVFSWDTASKGLGIHTLLAEAMLDGDNNPGNNLKTADITIQPQQVHDVAILAIGAPEFTVQGETVVIYVTVKNEGDFPETTDVTLSSNLAGNLGSKQVTLAPGGQEVTPFSWNTSGAVPGPHFLTAQAAAVAGETDTMDNTYTSLPPLTIIEEGVLHVESIVMGLNTRKVGKTKYVQASAKVAILDAHGSPVPNAMVMGTWHIVNKKPPADQNVYEQTDANGQVTLLSQELPNPPRRTTFTFTVTGVVKPYYSFNIDNPANKETKDQITY